MTDLVAEPEDTPFVAGAGVVESVAEFGEAIGSGDIGSIAVKGASAGIDALGVLTDPFGSLASAGVGWAIEHIGFLREPFDALLGDPGEIKAHARTWSNVSKHLKTVAADDTAALDRLSGWDGAAADAYRVRAREWTGTVRAAADEADRLVDETIRSAALTATVRSTIRDLIADFVAKLIGPLLAAVTAAAVTAGTSLVAFVAGVVSTAISLARKFAGLIQKLLDALGLASQRLADLIARLATLMQKAGTVSVGAVHLTPDFARWVGANPMKMPASVVKAEGKVGGPFVGAAVTGVDEAVQIDGAKEEARQDATV
ncbi:WXG100 family type VII secretion target [Pseudonocardia sp.]|uniref:WXG100 family type VII secretion target n=1 Tax=Pseudonocardia sp. TaxID=60912 RepID=UPI003D0BE2DF